MSIKVTANREKPCVHCGDKGAVEVFVGSLSFSLCMKCANKLHDVTNPEMQRPKDEPIDLKEKVLKSLRKTFHEKVMKTSYYDKFPAELIQETLEELGLAVVGAGNIILDEFPTPDKPTGVENYTLSFDGRIIGNSVLCIQWYDETVHGLKGRVEINAYIS